MPLQQRSTPLGRARGGAEQLSAQAVAERGVLGTVAEYVRERAQLQQVVLFTRSSETGLEEIARAAARGAPSPTEEERAISLEVTPGVRRFPRGAGGVHVVAAERHGLRMVAALGSTPEDAAHAEAEAALLELVQIASRVLAEPSSPLEEEASKSRGYGARLGDAVGFLERPPILAESRTRLTEALDQRHPAIGDAVQAIETDVGLATAVLATANRLAKRRREGVGSVPLAIEVLGPRGVLRVASELPQLRPLPSSDRMSTALLRLSAHAIAARAAASMIARALGESSRDELRLTAALHDIGKIALAAGSEDYVRTLAASSDTPEARLADERRALTLDHAAIGAVLLRRLGLPKSLATVVERHHADDVSGPAAIIRLADMLAHQVQGDAITPGALATVSRALRLRPEELQRIVYEIPRSREPRDGSPDPSPLTAMQEKVLIGLAEGKTYKQISAELGVSESTVRTHLHNLYRKIGVPDRAQAVLLATQRGWI